MSSLHQQAGIFRFLNRAFAYPNEAFLPELRNTSLALAKLAEPPINIIAAFEREPLESLQAEYTRLFINGYPDTPCPPYESVYLEHQMHGKATMDVQKAYREWDLSVEAGLVDHLSTEFEFLAFLATAHALQSPISEEAEKSIREFLGKHLCRWLPSFIADLKNSARIDAYTRLALWMESLMPSYCAEKSTSAQTGS
ncbi:MAG: molecular chaperone TorD family protein [Chlorobiaceae bacterium]|nr:molecular chaperone TorD family protein [Chlorobiaceae bacterium]NTV24840.1 molecular chaperone TorD family protein [Chlorobiaceae bacterium]